jgi:long-chain fatty acid transport protein
MFRRRLAYSFLIIVFALSLSTSAFASGFALYEGSARGNVLGAGLTASADDPSAVFYNPAGITQLKGKQAMIGVTFITPMISVETADGSRKDDFKRNWFYPPHAYYTHQIDDKWWAGVGVFSRFGLGTEFNPAWPGRYNSYKANIQTLELNPNIAYKISDKLSIAGGLSLMWFDLELKRKLNTAALGVGDTDFVLDGDSFGWGFNLAIHYKPTDWMQAGVSYRSRVSQHVEGDVKVSNQIAIPGVVNIVNMGGSGNLHLPDMIFAGVNFNIRPDLTLGGGIYWTRWDSYDKLEIQFDRPFGAPPAAKSTSRKAWDNVYRFLIGTEWKINPNWDLRLGYAFDEAPEPDDTIDFILPDNDRHMFSVGFGYHKNNWALDFSYTYMLIIDRNEIAARAAQGIHACKFVDGVAHLIGLSYTYKF